MIDKNDITTLATEFLTDSPNYLVDVSIAPGNSILVEIDNDNGVDIDDCIALSRHIESGLDREAGDFELTVTSAGLTSPLKTKRQYKKYEGKEMEIFTKKGEKINALLQSSDDEGFTVQISKMVKPEGAKRKVEVTDQVRFRYDEVKHTKYKIRF